MVRKRRLTPIQVQRIESVLEERRGERRQNGGVPWLGPERRSGFDRRQGDVSVNPPSGGAAKPDDPEGR